MSEGACCWWAISSNDGNGRIRGMAAGMVVGDLSAVAEVGNLWGEAEENFGGGRKSKSHVPQEARDVEHRVEGDDGCITWENKAKAAGRNARATRSITGKR